MWKRKDFSLERKEPVERAREGAEKLSDEVTGDKVRNSAGREFQIRGAACLKDLLVILSLESHEGS